ncbi:MAG TPA: cytochrome B6 [Gemmataceae bacterium]|jgi:cytochrome c peroxidase|nr:cytochrome B6 [Gemmataceae bacterium]
MNHQSRARGTALVVAAAVAVTTVVFLSRPAGGADEKPKDVGKTSYDQVAPALAGQISFADMMEKDKAAKDAIVKKQMALLAERYDLTPHLSDKVTMTRGKKIAVGPTAKLPADMTFEKLAEMSAADIREKGLFPKGYLPLPHPNHAAGGMLFPQHQIDFPKKENRQFARLERFDLDYDIREEFLPEFPPAIFLTTRPDLGDVSQGKVVTIENFQEIFHGILNGKDLDGLRLLLTQFPQQQFNATADRKTNHPQGMQGVACLDCHLNGHTTRSTHLVGDIRPQEHRRRINTPSLRGVNIQRLFGSQRALKSVEDFTEFEQLAAYFDGDLMTAGAKGMNRLDRSTQVHTMAEFQNLLDFPPAPGLGWDGKLDPKQFGDDTPEMKGQKLFFNKARCAECHPAPYYTDNTMHDLQVERFFKPQMINGLMATKQGPIKTFPLRGVKESPPFLHDGRLLTLEDTVEFFNLILELKLSKEEKAQLVAFLHVL